MINELKKITARVAACDEYATKYAEHIAELFAVVRAELIGEEYSRAIKGGEYGAAVAALAKFYRSKPKYVAKKRPNAGHFDKEKADKTVAGYAREVNIDWHFEDGELEGIFLNFSDPWPKDRHAKRRLTHRRNLTGFMEVMKPGGIIEFKTDNDSLFEFSLEEIADLGYEVMEMTRDLHNDPANYQSKEFPTEYEERFSAKGKNINYVKFRSSALKPDGQEEDI
jgi:hypothetical protein